MGKNIYINIVKPIATNGYFNIMYINNDYVLIKYYGNKITKHNLITDGDGNIFFIAYGVKYNLSDFIRYDIFNYC